jgi:hypothetical protein
LSATGRGGERHESDNYETPAWLCEEAVKLVPTAISLPSDERPCQILDPGCGSGAWGAEMRKRWPLARITGVELRDVSPHPAYNVWTPGTDFLAPKPTPIESLRLVAGNPPFSLAEQFVHQALGLVEDHGYVLFVLRLAFLEGQKRRDSLWAQTPIRRVVVCSRRPSFTSNGKTDSAACALFLWQKGYQGAPHLGWL